MYRGERDGMFDKENAEIIQGIARHVYYLQWAVGVGISFIIGVMSLVSGLLFKFSKDFKSDAMSKLKDHKDEMEKELRKMNNLVADLDDCREENAGNIIRLQEKVEAVVKVCQERHGK